MFYKSNIRYLQTTYISDVFAWLELSVTSSLSYNFVECYAWECYVSSGFSLHSLFALMMAADYFAIFTFHRYLVLGQSGAQGNATSPPSEINQSISITCLIEIYFPVLVFEL